MPATAEQWELIQLTKQQHRDQLAEFDEACRCKRRKRCSVATF